MDKWSHALPLNHHIVLGLTIHASIHFCHLSKGWNTSQMLFYFWQLHPATPGESKTISRPPERFSPFKVLSGSPLALLPVDLSRFISTGRSQNTILARLDWLYLAVQLTNPLGFRSNLLSSRDCACCLQRNVRLAAGICFLIYFFRTWNKAWQENNRF